MNEAYSLVWYCDVKIHLTRRKLLMHASFTAVSLARLLPSHDRNCLVYSGLPVWVSGGRLLDTDRFLLDPQHL